MTSSISKTVLGIDNIVKFFVENNYIILRRKIEKMPEDELDINHIYYESHIRLKLPLSFPLNALDTLCSKYNLHKSKNLFKTSKTHKYQMFTYRDYGKNLNKFKAHIEDVKYILDQHQIPFDKIEIEECIMDDNEKIDSKWLNE